MEPHRKQRWESQWTWPPQMWKTLSFVQFELKISASLGYSPVLSTGYLLSEIKKSTTLLAEENFLFHWLIKHSTIHNVRRPLPYIIMLLSWKSGIFNSSCSSWPFSMWLYLPAPRIRPGLVGMPFSRRKAASAAPTRVGAFLASLLSRLHYGHHGMDLAEKISPKRTKMFQHSGTQPWYPV